MHTAGMSAAFFSKRSPRIPVALSSGGFVKFEPIDLNTGVLKTEDPDVISGLTALIGSGRGGVSSLTESEYGDWLKKKVTQENSSRPYSQINETQTAGLVTVAIAPQTPPTPTLSGAAVSLADIKSVATSPKPLTEPPPIKLGKSK